MSDVKKHKTDSRNRSMLLRRLCIEGPVDFFKCLLQMAVKSHSGLIGLDTYYGKKKDFVKSEL